MQVHELQSAMAELGTELSLPVRVFAAQCTLRSCGGPSFDHAGCPLCMYYTLQEAQRLISLMDESGDGLIQFWEFVEFFKPRIQNKHESNVTDVVADTLKHNASQ